MITIAGREWNPERERLLSDGASGTELMKRGLPRGDAPERMNADNPEMVTGLAMDYMKAGSDIILTNSFVGSRCQLTRHGLAERTGELNRKAAEIAASAATAFTSSRSAQFFPRPLVAGSVGPTGKLVVMGEIGADELLGVFLQQTENLAEGGADLIVVETMADLEEMVVAVRAGVKTGLPVVASMTYNKVEDGYRTVMGNTHQACVDAALAEGASIIGANCGTGVENYTDLARDLCSMEKAPVWIKANAGLPELIGKETVFKQTPEEYAGYIQQLLDFGVSVVGGCCGTTPTFVQGMRRELDDWLNRR
jgi:5-methyltetrahydrofolate--homocysteine methyltransferase